MIVMAKNMATVHVITFLSLRIFVLFFKKEKKLLTSSLIQPFR